MRGPNTGVPAAHSRGPAHRTAQVKANNQKDDFTGGWTDIDEPPFQRTWLLREMEARSAGIAAGLCENGLGARNRECRRPSCLRHRADDSTRRLVERNLEDYSTTTITPPRRWNWSITSNASAPYANPRRVARNQTSY